MSGETRRIAKSVKPANGPTPSWHGLIGINGIGILMLLGAFGWSMARVMTIHHELNDPSVITLRISHWQLESGFREAMQAVITDYEQMHPGIRIVQMPVTEKVYAQWLNVNLIADNAPDLVEMGQSRMATTGDNIAKYFRPISREMEEINPYNAPQYLEDLADADPKLRNRLSTAPWRETVVDGMRGGYRAELQDYFCVSTSFFTVRMFYNKDMFKEVLGSEAPPTSLNELFMMSEKLRAYAKAKGTVIDPIAGSSYSRGLFLWKYMTPFSASFQPVVDWDGDGEMPPIETWAAFQHGAIGFGKPQMRAYYESMRKLCTLFNPNFAAMDRDQAMSAFAQGQAAMIASGSWDSASIFTAAKHFEVGVCNFPLPDPAIVGDDVVYPDNEASTAGGGSFGITKSSPHQAEALDFLRFLSSYKWDQKLNRLNGWLPVTIGATPDKRMMPFMPNPYGVSTVYDASNAYDLGTIMSGKLDLYLGGEITYDEFASGVESVMKDPNIGIDRIWRKQLETVSDQIRAADKTLAVQKYRMLLGVAGTDTPARVRETVIDQVSQTNGAWLRLMYQQLNQRALPEQP